jgi:hypothetical protein
VINTTTIRVKRAIQWDRSQIRVPGGLGGTMKKNIISDRYHCD